MVYYNSNLISIAQSAAMPITKRQFDLGIDLLGHEYMIRIYELLADDQELAFSEEELRNPILGDSSSDQQEEQFDAAIDALTRIRAITKKVVTDTNYYAFLEKFDTVTWEPDYSGI